MFIHKAHNNLCDNKANFLIVKIKLPVMPLMTLGLLDLYNLNFKTFF